MTVGERVTQCEMEKVKKINKNRKKRKFENKNKDEERDS